MFNVFGKCKFEIKSIPGILCLGVAETQWVVAAPNKGPGLLTNFSILLQNVRLAGSGNLYNFVYTHFLNRFVLLNCCLIVSGRPA